MAKRKTDAARVRIDLSESIFSDVLMDAHNVPSSDELAGISDDATSDVSPRVVPPSIEREKLYKKEENTMADITDEYMQKRRAAAKTYCLLILKVGPQRHQEGVEKIIWEHGRRNFSLVADGLLSIVCPVGDGSDVCGIGIFNAPLEEVKKIMDEDPGVKAGVFVYELHTCRGFPGSSLPA